MFGKATKYFYWFDATKILLLFIFCRSAVNLNILFSSFSFRLLAKPHSMLIERYYYHLSVSLFWLFICSSSCLIWPKPFLNMRWSWNCLAAFLSLLFSLFILLFHTIVRCWQFGRIWFINSYISEQNYENEWKNIFVTRLVVYDFLRLN